MKPALSVIFFTVASGAGLGLIVAVLLAQLAGAIAAGSASWWVAAALGGALLTAGLLSSTLHLANKRNAWRSLARFRSSWLSREGVFSLAIYPLAALHLALSWAQLPGTTLTALALIGLAFAVLVSTGMIYACLKTVPMWHSWQTPVGYVLYGLGSGTLIWFALGQHALSPEAAGATRWAAFALLAAGAAVKLSHWAAFAAPQAATLEQAVAVGRGTVRLLDVGHSSHTFLTDEFCFRLARDRARLLRVAAFVFAFVVPAFVLLAAPAAGASAAAVSALGGLLVQRWLFFAEAQHVVRLYHGQRRV